MENNYTDAQFEFEVLDESISNDSTSSKIKYDIIGKWDYIKLPHTATFTYIVKGLNENLSTIFMQKIKVTYAIIDKRHLNFTEGFSIFRDAYLRCVTYTNETIKATYGATAQMPLPFDKDLLIEFEKNRSSLS